MVPYIARWVGPQFKLNRISRHMLQLFNGQPGSRAWKRHITENSCRVGAGPEVILAALPETARSPFSLALEAP